MRPELPELVEHVLHDGLIGKLLKLVSPKNVKVAHCALFLLACLADTSSVTRDSVLHHGVLQQSKVLFRHNHVRLPQNTAIARQLAKIMHVLTCKYFIINRIHIPMALRVWCKMLKCRDHEVVRTALIFINAVTADSEVAQELDFSATLEMLLELVCHPSRNVILLITSIACNWVDACQMQDETNRLAQNLEARLNSYDYGEVGDFCLEMLRSYELIHDP